MNTLHFYTSLDTRLQLADSDHKTQVQDGYKQMESAHTRNIIN